ncbi:MAG: patatin family protein [Lachnospiraceae bacterium]|nr:patatin family protein [Lachnospiraceae bacterium]
MEKSGLVVEGGGMRGIYAAGVLDVMMEQGFTFDGVIGVSAGAIHGCTMVAGQRGRSIRFYKKYCQDKRFMSIRSWIKTGDIVGRDFCYRELPEVLDPFDYDAYAQSDTRFYATCSNLETGKAEYLEVTDVHGQIDIIRASASLPYVSRIVDVDGKKLLDGGCTDSIPFKMFQKMGYTRTVVVLTRDETYRKEAANVLPARFVYRKYPAFIQALKHRHEVYNQAREELARMQQEGNVFVICPSEVLTIDRMCHDPEKIQETYDIGRRDMENLTDSMRSWLEKCEG